ncbi:hypothetical protein COV04_02720 [Candidatus Uhrbacteria bacterium CG10_big_fil_rev_8_21_14_0_10_48_11]|uniref:SHS2 domain-containing protein n=1 Tax=Candidatus Uhrbacteria bacterium CG10_big_fil_rev_8_21_14_0_10_48_11 TaxID=1975037 RepID=A0A2M8LEG5_9BACT|nr:MAG: hypothetical protein COV04_02720 [Candidatus Uhrbacteria bacterium CG10_big_fil_rev_8_21_14_0_10_48_11]
MDFSFSLRSPRPPSAFGLDLSDDTLKIAQLRYHGKKITVDVLIEKRLPAKAIVDGEIKNIDAVSEALATVYGEQRHKLISSAIIALPEAQTFITTITVPKKGNTALKQLLQEALPEYLPDSVDKLYIDTQTLSENDTSWIVLVGAAPQILVEPYLAIAERAGVSPLVLDIEPIATANALIPHAETTPKTRAIINLGQRRGNLILHSSGSVLFTASLPISGEAVTEELKEQLKITKEQAEKTKRLCGLDPKKCEGVLRQVLERMVQQLLERIGENQKYYRDHFAAATKIEEIILAGGGAHLIGLDTVLSDALGIPVRLGTLWENVSVETPPELESELRYATVVGLAERALNDEATL